jgi:hypothetical protein
MQLVSRRGAAAGRCAQSQRTTTTWTMTGTLLLYYTTQDKVNDAPRKEGVSSFSLQNI